MKRENLIQPNRRHITVLRQICQLIPAHLVAKPARETGADDKARTFSPWRHVVAMLYAQINHALSLNDVCDALRLRLNLQSFLPSFAIVDTAGQHDNLRTHELCVGLSEREIALFDKAYMAFRHLLLRFVAWQSRW